MEFPRVLKKLQEEFPGVKKHRMGFPEVMKKVEFPGVLVLGWGIKVFLHWAVPEKKTNRKLRMWNSQGY